MEVNSHPGFAPCFSGSAIMVLAVKTCFLYFGNVIDGWNIFNLSISDSLRETLKILNVVIWLWHKSEGWIWG